MIRWNTNEINLNTYPASQMMIKCGTAITTSHTRTVCVQILRCYCILSEHVRSNDGQAGIQFKNKEKNSMMAADTATQERHLSKELLH